VASQWRLRKSASALPRSWCRGGKETKATSMRHKGKPGLSPMPLGASIRCAFNRRLGSAGAATRRHFAPRLIRPVRRPLTSRCCPLTNAAIVEFRQSAHLASGLGLSDGLVTKNGASSEGWHDQWVQVPPG